MKCLYCGEKLSWLQQLRLEKCCSREHQELFVLARDKHAFGELMNYGNGARPVDPEEQPAPEAEAEVEVPLDKHYARFLSMVEAERHYYQELLDRVPAGVAVIDQEMDIVYRNRFFRQLQNSEADDAIRLTGTSEELQKAITEVLRAAEEGTTASGVTLDERNHLISIRPAPSLFEEGETTTGVIVFVTVKPELAPATTAPQKAFAETA